ncbi:phosphatase PAP2 family protein [Thermophagus xiamenensis]|uniref:PAP2 superfamily protein n=1 Tax=Thermophagus xiamenensis TaxID=385682 RepID=A0A1I2DVP5_9BACT|nr:phosphatase PAP2 family protein [Thermophagus xiamenensis]SFE84675.1 PAP2 superfamily protein [Thermophagus xiamenensis]
MTGRKVLIMILVSLPFSFKIFGQEFSSDTISSDKKLEFKYSLLIIPTVLIGYGTVGIESDGLKNLNAEIKEELNENIDEKLTIDDFSQYAPTLTVYALNSLGIKGKNNFRKRTTILATSFLIMTATVSSLKLTTNITRPDGSSNNSFPSGHTSTAFMGAEFLWQEYKDVSAWYGITGYVIATGTGFFRMYNDRHWLTDVTTGAGIGILSTKIAYWVNPYISKKLFPNRNKQSASILYPYYNGEQWCVCFALRF